jgi:hypothetical protein
MNPWEVMVEVYEKNGQLTVLWLNEEHPVATLKGSWRGPMRPFGEPASSEMIASGVSVT